MINCATISKLVIFSRLRGKKAESGLYRDGACPIAFNLELFPRRDSNFPGGKGFMDGSITLRNIRRLIGRKAGPESQKSRYSYERHCACKFMRTCFFGETSRFFLRGAFRSKTSMFQGEIEPNR